MATDKTYMAGLAIESKSEMLHSLLEVMRLSLPEAEEGDIDMCLLLAGEPAGNINLIQCEALKNHQSDDENANGK